MTDFREVPEILRSFLTYHETIQGHSRATVDEYYLDLRTFFRFLKVRRGMVPRATEMEEISISDIDLDFVSRVTSQRSMTSSPISPGTGPKTPTRPTRLRAQRQLPGPENCHIAQLLQIPYPKGQVVGSKPLQDLDSPKVPKTLPRY